MIYKIKDIAVVKRGSSPRPIADYVCDSGLPWLKISDFSINDKYVYKTHEFIKEAGLKHTRYVKKGTLIVTNSATPGIPVFLGNDMCLHDGFLYFEEVSNKVDLDYLYYFLLYNRKNLVQLGNGSIFVNLKKEILENFEINLPDLETQKRIAKLLSSIDKRIALNKSMNDKLFSILHEHYLYYVEEKNSRGFCHLDSLWGFGKLLMGLSPKGESYNKNHEGTPLLNGAADYNSDGFLEPQKWTTQPTRVCEIGDLIFCIRATIGLLIYADKKYCLGRGVAAITKTNEISKEFIYHSINDSINELKQKANGSVIVGINKDDINKLLVPNLTMDDLKHFHTFQKPLFDAINNNNSENAKLSELRDILIPKLLSGEIEL